MAEAVQLTDKGVKRLGRFKGNLDKLRIPPCYAAAFKHMRMRAHKGVKGRLKLRFKIKLDKCIIGKPAFFISRFAEYELIIPSFSSFSIRAAVAGEERKT